MGIGAIRRWPFASSGGDSTNQNGAMGVAHRLGRRFSLLAMSALAFLLIPAAALADADVEIADVANGNVPGLSVIINGSGGPYYGDSIAMTFQNDTTEPLVVHVPIGTQLIPANVSTQTMITAGGENITVPPGGSQVIIKAFCGEKSDHAPTSGDTFTVGDRSTGDLLATAENINREGAFDSDGQAAIWHITDGAGVGEGSVAAGLVGSGLSDGEKVATAVITAGSAIAAAAAAGGGGSTTDEDLIPDEDLFPDEDWEEFDENDFEGFEDDEPEPDLFPDEELPRRPDPEEVREHTTEAIDELEQMLDQGAAAQAQVDITRLQTIDRNLEDTIKRIEEVTDPTDWDFDEYNSIAGLVAGLASLGFPPATVASVLSTALGLAANKFSPDEVLHQTRNLLAELHNMRGNVHQSIADLQNQQQPSDVPNVRPGNLSDFELEPAIQDLHNQAMHHLTRSHDIEQGLLNAQQELENQNLRVHEMQSAIDASRAGTSDDVGQAAAMVSLLTGLAGGAAETTKAAGMVGKGLLEALKQANNVASGSGTVGGFADWLSSLPPIKQQEIWREALNSAEFKKGMLTKQIQTLQQQHTEATQAFEAASKLRTEASNEYNSRFGRMPPRHLFGGGS